jgi:hypothetical protein
LNEAISDHQFVEWRFERETVPLHFWTDKSTHKQFFDWIMKECDMKDLSDWYSMHNRRFHRLGGSLFHSYGRDLNRVF